MAFYGYNGDVDQCQWTPYANHASDYDLFPHQFTSSYSFYEFEVPRSIQTSYDDHDFDYDATQSSVHYSAYGYNEPKLNKFEQSSYVTEHLYPQTIYKISYSTIQLNETSFDEYDPTPYDGGYDLAKTYGKPLPPSDDTCYPKSTPRKAVRFATYGSIPSPYGENLDSFIKSQQNGKGSSMPDDSKMQPPNAHIEDKTANRLADIGEDGNLVGIDQDVSYDYEKGLRNGYGMNGQVPNVPYGLGLEAMDICDGIFGYWPCLHKRNQQNHGKGEILEEDRLIDPWQSAADYLFGSGFGYEEPRNMSHGYYYLEGGESHYDHHFY